MGMLNWLLKPGYKKLCSKNDCVYYEYHIKNVVMYNQDVMPCKKCIKFEERPNFTIKI